MYAIFFVLRSTNCLMKLLKNNYHLFHFNPVSMTLPHESGGA